MSNNNPSSELSLFVFAVVDRKLAWIRRRMQSLEDKEMTTEVRAFLENDIKVAESSIIYIRLMLCQEECELANTDGVLSTSERCKTAFWTAYEFAIMPLAGIYIHLYIYTKNYSIIFSDIICLFCVCRLYDNGRSRYERLVGT